MKMSKGSSKKNKKSLDPVEIENLEEPTAQKMVILSILFLTIFIVSAVLRAPKPLQENWNNSDATYHVLLTVEAYDQTPVSVHKFVPIVSFGSPEDKGIAWGATVPDSKGNYYYTSFSPAQFVAPYAFIKLFHLPFSVLSLYIFNTLLFFLCWILTVVLFMQIFKGRLRRDQIVFFTSLIYLFQMEIMHSQGITYWAQSLFQFLFLCQVISYTRRENKRYRFLFYLLCFINPYVEWTGFVANFGFVLLHFMEKNDKKEKLKNVISVFSLTVLSGVAFCLHYLTVIPLNLFVKSLMRSFNVRGITAQASYLDLLKGYANSYTFLLIFILLLLIVCMCVKDARKNLVISIKKDFQYWIIFSVPLMENIIMKQHATYYSFDRIKGIFLLLLLFLTLYYSLISITYLSKTAQACCSIIIICLSVINVYNYVGKDNIYRWTVDYLKNNQILENYINQNYTKQNSVVTSSYRVRGYINTLYQRGIYENISDPDMAISVGRSKNIKYIVMLSDSYEPWNMDKLSRCRVIDSNDLTKVKDISVQNGAVIVENDFMTVDQSGLTDEYWENGISRNSSIILLPNSQYNQSMIRKGSHLKSGDKQVTIKHVDYDPNWIRVTCDGEKDLSAFAYPNVIEVVK